MREEVGIEVLERPVQAFGVYSNFLEFKNDHIAVFIFRNWRAIPNAPKSPEIAEYAFYETDKLPPGTTPSTRRRLSEIQGSAPQSYIW